MHLLSLILALFLALPDSTPVAVLFDTDMDTDCDDVGALAMLHALADRGEVHILGTMVSSHYPFSVPAVDVINTYYGRPDLPIGAPKAPGATLNRTYRYARELSQEFPHDLRSNDAAEDAVTLYRRILAGQPDSSVVLVTVGYLTNVRYLLESDADSLSPLTGMELAARKVRQLVVMGGRYPEHLDPGVFGNFKPDPESAVIVAQHWPGVIVFSGEGETILTGSTLAQTPPSNPVRRAYELYLGDLSKERPSWDQSALLYAVRGAEPFWEEITRGYNRIFDNGTNQWRDAPDSPHVLIRLKVDPAEPEAVIESLMTQPPMR